MLHFEHENIETYTEKESDIWESIRERISAVQDHQDKIKGTVSIYIQQIKVRRKGRKRESDNQMLGFELEKYQCRELIEVLKFYSQ